MCVCARVYVQQGGHIALHCMTLTWGPEGMVVCLLPSICSLLPSPHRAHALSSWWDRKCPSFRVTTAVTRWPQVMSGTPITATSGVRRDRNHDEGRGRVPGISV